MRPAARVTDTVAHPIPPVLVPGPGAITVLIGGLPAWRALNPAAAAGLVAAKAASEAIVMTAEASAVASAGVPIVGAAARVAAETAKGAAAASMGAMIGAMAAVGADIHACVTPWPVPPHGPGVVIGTTVTVLIGTPPAPPAHMGDTIVEAIGPPNAITMGCMTVLIA